MTGHNEVVFVVYDPARLSYDALLRQFWESHDPTQGMRQGNDVGHQYRSGIYAFTAPQLQHALASKAAYQSALEARGFGEITTETLKAPHFLLRGRLSSAISGQEPVRLLRPWRGASRRF
jgi:peptide-methionine (S)-S-oxide reductase